MRSFKIVGALFLHAILVSMCVAQNLLALENSGSGAEAVIRGREETLQARISARIKSLDKQYPSLRMVIGGPCYFWGIDDQIESELKAAGMEVLCWPNAPLLDPNNARQIGRDPMKYNIIIFGDTFYHLIQPDPNTGEIPKRIRDQVPLLRKFLEAGGGVWFCGLGEQNWGRSAYALNYILKELGLGAEVVGEVVMDTAVMNQGRRLGDYAWVEILSDPLTKGVRNLLHPSGVIASEGSMGVVPIVKLSPDWRVLLNASASAASFPCDPTNHTGSLLPNPVVVKSSPILCAVRQAGKGRVVLWPTWSNFTVTGGSGGMLVDGEKEEKLSDGARLIENLLCWLAEPSQGSEEVGTFDPEQYEVPEEIVDVDKKLEDWKVFGRKDYPHQYKGLIGAHSNLSDGLSSPEEMIETAKKAGYQFIAFTEDFAKMNEEKWNELLAICDNANASDPNFIAYPGLDFLDEAGNRGVVFGHRYWIKDKWRSEKDPNRIRWFYNLTYAADADANRWPPRVIIRSRTNNKRPWNQGLWSFFGAYCYKGDKLVDDSFAEWRPLISRHVFFMNTGIMAVHTVRTASEIIASSSQALYQTYVRADSLSQVLSRISGCVGPMAYFPSYISQGPEILDFKCYVAVMGGEHSFDLANPDNDRGLLHVLVQSAIDLQEVAIYDGERLVRRFRPKGNRFETFLTFHPDSYHCYSLTVTDKQAREAVSWNAFMQIQQKVHRRCGDNWNWMTTGKGPGSLTPPKFSYQLLEVTSGWKTKSEKKRPKRRLYWCEQGSYSHGGLSAAINRYIFPDRQGILVDDKPWNACYPAMTMDFATIGRYGVIVTNTVRGDYLVKKPKPYTTGCFSSPYKRVPSPWPADLKQFVPMRKPDGATINRYQGKVTFTKKVSTLNGKPVRISLGATGDPQANIVEVMNANGSSKRHKVGEGSVSGKIPAGGYICWYDDKGDGVGGVIALSPGIHYSYTKKWQQCFMYVPSPVNPGTEVSWDLIFVTGNRSTSNSNKQMLDVWRGMGIAGKSTLYKVEQKIGKLTNQKFFLTFDAEDYAFSGKIVKTTDETLPIHLPVMIKNLNPRWDAGIWYRGKTHLHTVRRFRDRWGDKTWRWKIATYEPRVDEVRYIPVLEGGVGYCQVETDKQDPDIFIGNLLVCDQPEVFITVVKAEKGRCKFEINNPTHKKLTCTVRPSKGFDLVGKFRKRIVLPSGGFRKVTVNQKLKKKEK